MIGHEKLFIKTKITFCPSCYCCNRITWFPNSYLTSCIRTEKKLYFEDFWRPVLSWICIQHERNGLLFRNSQACTIRLILNRPMWCNIFNAVRWVGQNWRRNLGMFSIPLTSAIRTHSLKNIEEFNRLTMEFANFSWNVDKLCS